MEYVGDCVVHIVKRELLAVAGEKVQSLLEVSGQELGHTKTTNPVVAKDLKVENKK